MAFIDGTISSQAQCSASLRGTPSSLRRLRLVVVAHHTAPQLRAQRPLPACVSCRFLIPVELAHAVKTYVFFLFVRPSSTSCSPAAVRSRRWVVPAYHAHRDSTPSRLCFDLIWRRRSVGKERGQWFCRDVVSVLKCWNREVARDGLRDGGCQAHVTFTAAAAASAFTSNIRQAPVVDLLSTTLRSHHTPVRTVIDTSFLAPWM